MEIDETEPLTRQNMAEAVDEAVASGTFGAADAGVVALVRRYADELDTAAAVEAEFEALLASGELSGREYQRLTKLEGRVRASQTVEGVGPKLLAALESLGLSPAARAKVAKGVPTPPATEKPKDELAALRSERLRKV